MYWLFRVSFILAIAGSANLILQFIMMYLERRNRSAVYFWTPFILVFPLLGFLAYLLVGRGALFGGRRRVLERYGRQARYLKSTAKGEDEVAPDVFPLIARYASEFGGCPVTAENRVELDVDIAASNDEMFKAIRSAEKFINVQFYIIQPDSQGEQLVRELTERAASGVKVRLLYDALGSKKLKSNFFDALEAEGGMAVKFFSGRLTSLNGNYRNHRKLVIVDNKVGFMGGANIGDEYLGADSYLKPWRDMQLKLKGECVHMMNLRFMHDFNFAAGTDFRPDKYIAPQTAAGQSTVQLLFDGPDREEGLAEQCYLSAIRGAAERIWIETPYLAPTDALLNALKTAARSGVEVRVVLPQRPDHRAVYECSMSYAAELVAAGCEVFLFKGFMHSKVLIIDSCFASVGSVNLDSRSLKLNFESTALLYTESDVKKAAAFVDKDISDSKQYTLRAANKRTGWVRLKQGICRFFSSMF